MKIGIGHWVLGIGCLLLGGCLNPRAVSPDAPAVSTAAVSRGISDAADATTAAQASVQAADAHVEAARTRAQRIDDKAVVLLKYWDTAP